MRMQKQLAMILTVLLLSISCLSSACQMSCDLHSRMAICHRESVSLSKATQTSSEDEMVGMKDCGMRKASTGSSDVLSSGASDCAHQVCAESPAIPEPAASFSAHLAPIHVIVVALLFGVAPAMEPSFSRPETPPFIPLSPVALHTTLRV